MEDQDPTELSKPIDATEAQLAWADADPPEVADYGPHRVRLAIGAALALIAAAGGVALWQVKGESVLAASPTTSTSTTTTVSSTVPAPPPSPIAAPVPTTTELKGVDGEFISEMRGYGVPVADQDPEWSVNLAQAVCTTAEEGGFIRYPPGTSTVLQLTDGIMENNPDWTWQQGSRFTNGAIDYYCPAVRGPSQQEIDAMPPDRRYLALLQDKTGITPSDDSLVRAAYQICDFKAQGWWNDDIIDTINSPNPPDDERIIVESAITVYCPQFG